MKTFNCSRGSNLSTFSKKCRPLFFVKGDQVYFDKHSYQNMDQKLEESQFLAIDSYK